MGNTNSEHRLSTIDPIKKENFQELHDICDNYLEHFEFIIESGANTEDPRQILAVLKANCQTAREQISKLPTKQRRRYSSVNDSELNINNINIKNSNKRNSKTIKNGKKGHHKAASSSNTSWVIID